VEAVFLDTCVLLKSYLCDTLLSLAEDGTFRPLWSPDVLEELRRNLVKLGIKPEAAEHRLDQMTAFFPDAQVTDYEDLVPAMTNHPKDRHVLAAAITGRAEVLVTENLHDFPATAAEPHDILVLDQDEFLLSQLEQYPRAVRDALRRQASRYRREPRTAEDLLTVLSRPGHGCPRFAERCRQLL
jgi:predicted nucleic acid-binding protein